MNILNIKFNKNICISFLTGYFILGEIFAFISRYSVTQIIYPLYHAIFGMGIAIILGLIVGVIKNGRR